MRIASLILACVLLGACAPSNQEVRLAKAAEYDPREYAAVYEACKAAMVESGYEIAGEDLEHGILVSSWRWYTKEGTAKRKEAPKVENGATMFRIAVELARGPKGGLVVHVDGGAQGYSTGSPVLREFKHDDPEEPTWVEGKIDNLAVGIHTKLSQFELHASVPGATPAAPATPAPATPAPAN